MSVMPFSTKVFDSLANMQQFLKGSSAIKEILAASKAATAPAEVKPPKTGTLDGIWSIVWIVITEPFALSWAVLEGAIGIEVFALGIIMGSRSSKRDGYEMMRDGWYFLCRGDVFAPKEWKELSWEKIDNFGKNLLVACHNEPAPGTQDICTHPPVDYKALTETVRKVIWGDGDGIVRFGGSGGKCRGIEDWFAYLYLQTRAKFSDPRQHVMAVAKIFEKGAPKEAVFLQDVFPNLAVCLGIDRELIGRFVKRNQQEELPVFIDKTARVFGSLKPGIYKVSGIPKHAISFIKSSANQFYLHDPNIGLVAAHSLQEISDLWKRLDDYYDGLTGVVRFQEYGKASSFSKKKAGLYSTLQGA